jgi:hypothetical protein
MSDDDVIDVRGVVMAAMSSRCSGAGEGWAEAVGGLAVSIFGNNNSCVWTPLHTAWPTTCIKLYDVCIRCGLSEHGYTGLLLHIENR